MSRFRHALAMAISVLLCVPALVAVTASPAAAADPCVSGTPTTTCTYDYTGSTQHFTVPAGVSEIEVDLYGAGGGDSGVSGGEGAKVHAVVSVTAGTVYDVEVGQQGLFDTSDVTPNQQGCIQAASAYNGGGRGMACKDITATPGVSRYTRSGGGGGATDLRPTGGMLASRVLVAAGGGGAGADHADPAGVGGASGHDSPAVGGGKTPVGATGGAGGGTDVVGTDGSLGVGGDGKNGGVSYVGGGGGGGYYGGGGGGLVQDSTIHLGGGGGGSNYVGDPSVQSSTVTDGANEGDGKAVISFGNPDLDDDQILNGMDNCPTTSNSGQDDADSDGKGDVCDPCPSVAGVCADLSITNTDGVTSVTQGGGTTYSVVVTNNGPDAVTNASVSDNLPGGLAATTCDASAGSCTVRSNGFDASVTLASGQSVTFTLAVNVASNAPGSVAATASVAAPSGVTDPTPDNNSATIPTPSHQ